MGHIGDKVGRKTVMVGTLLLMGTSTFLISCLPTYSSPSASGRPSCWFCCGSSRACQHPANRPARTPCPSNTHPTSDAATTPAGRSAAPSAARSSHPPSFCPSPPLLTDEQLQTWGWRIPFLLSAIVGWVAVSIFVAVICLISGISVALGRETNKTPMDDLGKKPADLVGATV
jgi:MFS family permease